MGKLVSEQFNTNAHYNATSSKYDFTFTGLDNTKTYQVVPLVKFGNWVEMRASPSEYFKLNGGFSSVDEEGLTGDIHNLIPDEYIKDLKELGLEINGGNTPPNIEGTYIATPLTLVKSTASINIAQQWDMYVTFSGQNNTALSVNADYTLQAEGPWWSTVTMSSSGPGSFIVGEGNKFTVFVNAIREESGYTAKTVEVFSGEISTAGIKNYQWAVIMVDDRGDPLNLWIENGEGYLKKDSDGFSERVNQSKAPSPKTEVRSAPNRNNKSKNLTM